MKYIIVHVYKYIFGVQCRGWMLTCLLTSTIKRTVLLSVHIYIFFSYIYMCTTIIKIIYYTSLAHLY